MKSWEEKKRSFKGPTSYSRKKFLRVSLPRELVDRLDQTTAEELQGDLTLTLEQMLNLFDGVIEQILKLIDGQLTKCELQLAKNRQEDIGQIKISKLFLVGGFAGSEYLLTRVKEKFGDRVGNIFRPQDPGSSVVKGAVLCGLNPRLFAARCARLTYGTLHTGPWTPDNPMGVRAKRWSEKHQEYRADNYFDTMVHRDQQVETNEEITHVFVAEQDGYFEGELELEIFTSEQVEEKYFSPSMKQVGVVTISIPPGPGGSWVRSGRLSFKFGTTEIDVEARNIFGEKSKAKIDFFSYGG